MNDNDPTKLPAPADTKPEAITAAPEKKAKQPPNRGVPALAPGGLDPVAAAHSRAPQEEPKDTGKKILLGVIVGLVLLLLGIGIYTVRTKFGSSNDTETETARLIQLLQEQNETSKKEKEELAAELDAEKVAKLAEAKRLLMEVEAARAKANNEEKFRKELETDLAKQRELEAAKVSAAKVEAETAINTRLADEEAARKERLRKSKEVVVQDLDPKDFGPIQMDKDSLKTHWVPLVTNRSGNPAPFNSDDSAPRKLAHRGATWESVNYVMENGATVKAWGIRLGKDGLPLGHQNAPKQVRSGLP